MKFIYKHKKTGSYYRWLENDTNNISLADIFGYYQFSQNADESRYDRISFEEELQHIRKLKIEKLNNETNLQKKLCQFYKKQ